MTSVIIETLRKHDVNGNENITLEIHIHLIMIFFVIISTRLTGITW